MSEQKKNNSLEGLSGKQRSEALTQQKEQRKWKMYGIITAVILVLIAALLFWDKGFVQRSATAVTIGEKNYSAVDVDYYYYSQYNIMRNYASYYGFDAGKSLKEQEAQEGQTWYDYILENAMNSLTNVSVLAQEAEKAGYTISEEGQSNIDEVFTHMDEECKEYGISRSYYLTQMFGRHMNLSRFKKIINEYYYAYDYQQAKVEGFEVKDADIDAYYTENKDKLDTYDYQCYMIDAEAPTTYDADNKAVEPTAAETAQALANADALSKVIEKALTDGDQAAIDKALEEGTIVDRSGLSGTAIANYPFGEWLQNASRKSGDVSIFTDTETPSVTVETEEEGDESAAEEAAPAEEVITAYYVARFNGRALDEYKAGTIRSILVEAEKIESEAENAEATYDYDAAKTQAEALKAEFTSNGADEAAFIALDSHDEAAEESEEEEAEDAPHYHASLSESAAKGSLTDTLEDWLYGSEHKAGDCEVILDEDSMGYQLVYFVGYDDVPYWRASAKSTLQNQAYSDWYTEVKDSYGDAVTNWLYGQVG